MRLPSSSQITIRELLTLAIYDRSRIALGALIPFVFGLAASFNASSWYESSASLLVLRGNEYLAKSPSNAAVTDLGLEPKQILSAEAELVDNRNLLLQVLAQDTAHKIYPSMAGADQDRVLARLQSDLKIEAVFTAGVLRLTLRNPDPEVASATLQKIIALYLESRNATVGDQKTASMSEQADQMAAKLKDAESRLNQFSVDNGISDMKDQRSHLLKLRSDLLTDQGAAQAMIVSRETELNTTMKQLQSIPLTLESSSSYGRIRELENAKASLLTLELRRKDLISRLSENSEEVANVDLQISTVKSFLATEPELVHDSNRQARNPAYDMAERHATSLDAEIKGLEANNAQATKDVATVNRQLSTLDGVAQDYDRLAEAQRTAEEPLLAYLPKLEELKINEELSRRLASNVRLIEAATLPTERRSNSMLYLGTGIFLGVVGGLAATFGRTSLRQVCVLPTEMEEWLNMQSLLVIGYKEPEASYMNRRPR
jgi:uncharacterized protein involved in exopolysaccharide biosynthesis